MTKTFTAQINNWSDKAKRNINLVVKKSAEEVFTIAQQSKAKGGKMPVDTGGLKGGLVSGLNGSIYAKGEDSYQMVIAGMEMGDVMFGGWTATYALHQEYGTSKMAGNFYMRSAAQQWQAIVAKNAARLK